MNLIKTNNGFILLDKEYLFQDFLVNDKLEQYEILSSVETHIGTNKGIIFFNISVTINNQTFTTIQDFLNYLYS